MKSIIAAFAMYSKIPMPRLEWSKKNLRYIMAFFPLVGAVLGSALWGWHLLAERLGFIALLFAAGATALPIVFTGGLHMDGFIDTVDAWHCHGEPEKRRVVLKDPHVGAFGVIWCGAYLVVVYGLWAQIYEQPGFMWLAAAGFVFSRALTALLTLTEKAASDSGILCGFAVSADKKTVIVVLLTLLLMLAATGIYLAPAVCATLAIVIFAVLLLCIRAARKEFGGVSGDLAGFFLQVIEILILAAAAVGGALL